MSTNSLVVQASPAEVWDVLADGWLYPLWVVGASRVRDVDESWPSVGSLIHHSVGAWPLLLDDNTEVVECKPGSMLRLRARGWPVGEAEVILRLSPAGAGTEVSIEEDAVSGPGRLVPAPLRHATLKWRNVETLRRLAYVAEGRPAALR
ncbi:SRPBCC family protein [Nocardioides sp.]|uniref:SRPBCC family protein n=1 Tax=Nocardioides sp. TaxID=35761 RepID=UPI003D0F21A0